jgi:hypothetical protein
MRAVPGKQLTGARPRLHVSSPLGYSVVLHDPCGRLAGRKVCDIEAQMPAEWRCWAPRRRTSLTRARGLAAPDEDVKISGVRLAWSGTDPVEHSGLADRWATHKVDRDPQLLLPPGAGLVVEQVQLCDETVHLTVRCEASGAHCQKCGTWSEAFHSSYERNLGDLPIAGSAGHHRPACAPLSLLLARMPTEDLRRATPYLGGTLRSPNTPTPVFAR